MKLLKQYLTFRHKIFEYFGYVEDWVVLPLNDCTEYHWQLEQNQNGGGCVSFAMRPEWIGSEIEDWFQYEIYTQCFLPKWVYRAEEYTMIVVDTHTDGNRFLSVFDNKKEIK